MFLDQAGYAIGSATIIVIIIGAVGLGTAGSFGGNAIANKRGDTGWAKAGWIAGGALGGGAGAGIGYAAPIVFPGLVPALAPVYDAIANAGTQAVEAVSQAALNIPSFVTNAGSFISWLEGLKLTEDIVYQLGPVQQLYNMAIDFGVNMVLNTGHGGADLWTGPHIYFGINRVHVAISQEAFDWLQKMGVLLQ